VRLNSDDSPTLLLLTAPLRVGNPLLSRARRTVPCPFASSRKWAGPVARRGLSSSFRWACAAHQTPW